VVVVPGVNKAHVIAAWYCAVVGGVNSAVLKEICEILGLRGSRHVHRPGLLRMRRPSDKGRIRQCGLGMLVDGRVIVSVQRNPLG
jgi:hypothetical protein